MSISSHFGGVPEDTVIWHLHYAFFEAKLGLDGTNKYFKEKLGLVSWDIDLRRVGKFDKMIVVTCDAEVGSLMYYYLDLPNLKKGICLSAKDAFKEEKSE